MVLLRRPSDNLLLAGGALFVLVWLAICGVGIGQYFAERRAVVSAIERVQLLERNMINIESAEAGQRGFLLTSDPSYLAPYEAAKKNIDATLSALAAGFADSGLGPRARLNHLGAKIAAKRWELERTIVLRKGGDEAAALAIVRTNEGQDLMNSIRADSEALVEITLARIARARHLTKIYLLITGLSSILLAAGVGLLIGVGYARQRLNGVALQRLVYAFQLTQGLIRTIEGHIIVWSDGAARLYGISATEAVGKVSHELLESTFTESLSSINAALLNNGRWQGEQVHRSRDGEWLRVNSQWILFRENNGQPSLVIEINNDITEVVRARNEEAQNARARSQLAAIVESSNDAIIGKDTSGIITSWNEAAEGMFGYAAADIIGEPITTLIPSTLIDEEREILERVLRGEKIVQLETMRLRKDGETIPVSLTISPIRDAANAIVGVSKIARDLTERRDRERRLRELQGELAHVLRLDELGQMAAALAHEVNQPLTAITNYVSGARYLLAAGNLEGTREAVERVAEQTTRAALIVRSLRAYGRKGDSERRKENLPVIVEDVTTLALVGIGHRIKLDMRFDPQAREAVIDKVQIQQVLFNLVRNAVEAMETVPRRELTIATTVAGDMLEVSVADTGVGLPETIRATLFQPFNTTKENGMGMGVSICRAIVEAHGGKILATEADGGGTVFSFTLPRGSGNLDPSLCL